MVPNNLSDKHTKLKEGLRLSKDLKLHTCMTSFTFSYVIAI